MSCKASFGLRPQGPVSALSPCLMFVEGERNKPIVVLFSDKPPPTARWRP